MLLLCIWEETWYNPESRDLQERVTNALLTAGQGCADSDANREPRSHRIHWLSTRHIRTLVALMEDIRNTSPLARGVSPNMSVYTPEESGPNGAHMSRNNNASTAFSPMPDQMSAVLGQR